jgi:D-glycero-alpha-D-manno-heptose-7-phosphate kinase
MIVTRAPLRISFFGGGSDIPQFYENYEGGGAVLSTTIDKYVYTAVHKVPHKHYKVSYSAVEIAKEISNIEHDRVREMLMILNYQGYDTGLEISSFADIPTTGSGLGSSSSFTVALAQALYPHGPITPLQLAEFASFIEIDCCNEPIGKQDQYAAALGGFNFIQFYRNKVEVKQIKLIPNFLGALESRLMLFDTNIRRDASTILSKQVDNLTNPLSSRVWDYTQVLAEMAQEGLTLLQKGEMAAFGGLLHRSWEYKKSLSNGITNEFFDEGYSRALDAGALGGKILGAGGGGYMLLYVPLHNQACVRDKIGHVWKEMDFKFSNDGVKVICNDEHE